MLPVPLIMQRNLINHFYYLDRLWLANPTNRNTKLAHISISPNNNIIIYHYFLTF